MFTADDDNDCDPLNFEDPDEADECE